MVASTDNFLDMAEVVFHMDGKMPRAANGFVAPLVVKADTGGEVSEWSFH